VAEEEVEGTAREEIFRGRRVRKRRRSERARDVRVVETIEHKRWSASIFLVDCLIEFSKKALF
jgi:hypothetical protein